MGHKNKKSLVMQITETLTSKLATGESKHAAKANNATADKIYSYNTLRSYIYQSCKFAKYVKEAHKCKKIEDCRPYVDEYLQYGINRNLSPYTLKLQASALAKLYGCSGTDFIKTPSRKRSEITRSRKECERDKHFSEKKNADLVTFCKSTGLRRRELRYLTGDKLRFKNGKPYVLVTNGKGGKIRLAPVTGDPDKVAELMKKAGTGKVFATVSKNADIHHFRACYAKTLYKAYARPIETLSRHQRYYCRGDMKGVVFDRAAMLKVSKALGHDRLNVIAGHYLY